MGFTREAFEKKNASRPQAFEEQTEFWRLITLDRHDEALAYTHRLRKAAETNDQSD